MVKTLSEWWEFASDQPLESQPLWFDCLWLLYELEGSWDKYYCLSTDTSKLPNVICNC